MVNITLTPIVTAAELRVLGVGKIISVIFQKNICYECVRYIQWVHDGNNKTQPHWQQTSTGVLHNKIRS